MMAVYRGPVRRVWRRFVRSWWRHDHVLFAGLLAKPGFNADQVRAEVAGRVAHGPAGQAPQCLGQGAIALLAGCELGWVAPVVPGSEPAGAGPVALPDRMDGWIRASWITGWSLSGGELVVDYQAPAPGGHDGGPRTLRVAGLAAALAEFVARARRQGRWPEPAAAPPGDRAGPPRPAGAPGRCRRLG